MTRTSSLRLGTALMATASTLCFAAPALAGDVLFSTYDRAAFDEGARVNQIDGLTQLRLDNGATASFVDAADYRINADGTIDLYAGSVTVAGGDGTTLVRMPEGVEGQVSGTGSAARFSVGPDGRGSGHVLTGSAQVGRNGSLRRFAAGEMFEIAPGERVRQVVSNGAQATPDAPDTDGPVLAMGGDAGPVAAARNGLPVTLGDALAAAGASGDILGAARRVEAAVGNPSIETFPVGDLQLLISAAGGLEGAYGGTPFTGAQADIIRTYLQYLANGGAGQNFLSAYAGFLTQYLNLIRSGAAPSTFGLASLDQIDSFIAFTDRTGGFGGLSAQNRVLVEAYLAFIEAGGDADAFAGSFTDLTEAYFAFIRAGGNPTDFTGATQATLDAYIAFLSDSGLLQQLSAADRALVAAYLQNGGFAFAAQYRTALDAYFAYLAAGNLPSGYTAVDPATLQAYLATLQGAGLLGTVLGDRADFYAAYLAYLQAGGSVDGFAGLPANIFADYATQLNAYFAYLAAGNLPSAYTAADVAALQAYLAQLQAAGALDRFLGGNAAFFADYLAFLQGGGQVDAFAGLNANIFAGYASALAAYYDYLANGGVPSSYGALTQEQIAAYVAALQGAGATGRFLDDLADFYTAYFAYLAGGGNPDTYAGLPVPPDFPAFAAALNAYYDYLANGGLPAAYSAADLALLQTYLEAIVNSGQVGDLLGGNATLLQAYFAYLAGGGAPNGFTGLPIYADYVAALNAYYAFLAGGGLPGDYAGLDAATIRAYLAALDAVGGLGAYADLAAFFGDYYAFISGGGDPAEFAGLPIYQNYLAAIQAYYQFLIGGGVPSDYTALDLTLVEAYLAALANAGILGGSLDAAIAAFLTDYLAFVQGGGDPDQFAGLPGNGGGPLPAFDYPYRGGFPTGATVRIAAASGFTTASRDDIENYAVGASGELLNAERTGFGTAWLGASAGLHKETYGDESAIIGRYSGGDAQMNFATVSIPENGGVHYLLLAPSANPAPTPQTALTVDYDLLAATSPTFLDGHTAPGSFAGDLRIVYASSELQAGLWGSITMPEASGDTVYNFDTRTFDGNLTSFGALGPNDDAITLISRISDIGDACTTGDSNDCRVRFDLYFGGATRGDRVGTVYNTSQVGSNQVISGAALFGAPTPLDGGSGGDDFLVYEGGFDTQTPILHYAYGGTWAGSPDIRARGTFYQATIANSINADGSVNSVTQTNGNAITRTSAASEDVHGDENMLIGRWNDGQFRIGNGLTVGLTANQGFHYLLTRGSTPSFALPTTGRIDYTLVGATQPTIADGSYAPGTFDMSLAFLLGASVTVVGEGTITMPGVGGAADLVWNFGSTGGMANPGQSTTVLAGSFDNRQFQFAATPNAHCASNCSVLFAGVFGNNDPNRYGAVYVTQGMAEAKTIQGAAIFQGDYVAPGGGGAATGSDGVAPTGTAGNYFTFIGAGGSGSATASAMTVTDNLLISASSSRDSVEYVGNGNTTEQGGGDQGVIGWSRFGNVTANYRTSTGQAFSANPFASQFWHNAWGTPVANLPASGLVNYELIGATTATQTNAQPGEGTFSGDFSVDFSTLKAGLEAQVAFNGETYSFASAGGVAAPSVGLFDDGFGARRFSENLATTTSNGSTVSRGTFVQGFLAGDGASHAGLTYSVRIASSNAIQGAAAFRAADAATASTGARNATAAGGIAPSAGAMAFNQGTPLPPATQGGSGGVGQGAAIAGIGTTPTGIDPGTLLPPPSLSDPADAFDGMWARFAGPGGVAPGVAAPGSLAAGNGSPNPVGREQAEAWLGGMITFNPR